MPNSLSCKQRAAYGQQGFSIVEIMVGVAIGILATLVIFQTVVVNNRQAQATAGGSDASATAAMSLTVLEGELRNAGFGIDPDFYAGANGNTGCTQLFTYKGQAGGADDELQVIPPVSIVSGGDSGSDTLVIRAFGDMQDAQALPGGSSFQLSEKQTSENSSVIKIDKATDLQKSCLCQSGSSYASQNDLTGCVAKAVLKNDSGQCWLVGITGTGGSGSLQLQHNSGQGKAGDYNPSNPKSLNWNFTFDPSSTELRCLGNSSTPQTVTWKVDSGYLTRQVNSGQAEAMFPNVLALKAQLGIDTDADGTVDTWVNGDGEWACGKASGDTSLNTANCKLLGVWDAPGSTPSIDKIIAVRAAVLVKSAQYEKPEPGKACEATDDAALAKMMPASSGTPATPYWAGTAFTKIIKAGTDWQCYRYKVSDTVVPLKNIIWRNEG